MNFKSAIFAVSALASSVALANPAQQKDFHVGLELGYGFGGDTLAEVEFQDGSSESIDAGSGLFFGIDLLKPLHEQGQQPLYLKMGIGYMFDSINAENGSADFTRFPIDMTIATEVEQWQLGAGLTYHLNPTYEDDFFGSVEVEADNAMGFTGEASYTFPAGSGWKNTYVGLKYTNIEYDFNGATFDGSGFALTVGSTF